MTMAAKVIFLVALVALVSSQQTDDAFSPIDVNGNGSLSATELEAYCDQLDRNNDGSVNYREFTSFNDTLAATNEYKAQFAYYDNISGVMDDKLVCRDDAFTFFGKLDVNSDGKVSSAEFTTVIEQMRQAAVAQYGNNPMVG